MTNSMTADQAKTLAKLVNSVRPGWAVSAIASALWHVRDRPLHRVAAAALRCANDPDMQTPAAIAWVDRPHWKPESVTVADIPTWHDPYADATPADPDAIRAIRARKDRP